MDVHSYYDLQLLNHLEDSPHITHRIAADKLGVSVKLSHSVIKGLIARGLIHTRKRDGRSFYYFLTPAGITEKVRLTYKFLNFSKQFYHEARKRSSEVCRNLVRKGVRKIAFLGCGDLAEISYLGVKEHGLNLTAVFDNEAAGQTFMGIVTKPVKEALVKRSKKSRDFFEYILVTAYDLHFPMRQHHIPDDIEPDNRFIWVFDHGEMVERVASRVPKLNESSKQGV